MSVVSSVSSSTQGFPLLLNLKNLYDPPLKIVSPFVPRGPPPSSSLLILLPSPVVVVVVPNPNFLQRSFLPLPSFLTLCVFGTKMATKPMTKDVIALTEKKMDMALDDIIKMSKTGGPKVKKSRLPNKSQRNFSNVAQQKSTRFKQYMNSRSSVRQGVLAQRRSNFQGSQFPLTNEAAKRASALPFRNGFLIRERRGNPNRGRNGAAFSNFNSSNATYSAQWEQQQQELNTGPKQKPHTLDVLFASLKEQRLNSAPRRNGPSMRSGPSTRGGPSTRNGPSMHNGRDKQIPPWSRGRFGK